jgi:ssDNA-binding Zn-finger/Zn-ribbon topoisomerase 1
MVLTAQRQEATQEVGGDICPKCNGQMRKTYTDQEPNCWVCGFVDYTFVPRMAEAKSILATGTEFLVRYTGAFPAMKNRLVHIKAVRGSGVAKISHDAECPFCGSPMDAVALSIKRKHVSEDRYICPDGHRISLLQTRDGGIGWK